MKEKIMQKLRQIENDYQVTILLACESGSRAWGFPSADSDYDVRFIYAHKPDWYLSIARLRDVIELPIEGLLDINGWDLRKALGLLRKSNPALLEWLSSPIIYQKQDTALKPLLALAQKAFLPESCCHHYLSMCQSGMAGYRNAGKTKLKKYLYSVRPLLCCQWVIEHATQPPILFNKLVDLYLPSGEIRDIINNLLAIKKSTKEKDWVDRNKILEHYINTEYERLKGIIPKNSDKEPLESFNSTFREILQKLN